MSLHLKLEEIQNKIIKTSRKQMYPSKKYMQFYDDLLGIYPDLEIKESCFYGYNSSIICSIFIRKPDVVIKKDYAIPPSKFHLERAKNAFEHNRRHVRMDIMRHGIANIENTTREINQKKEEIPVTKVFKQDLAMGKEQEEFRQRWEKAKKEHIEQWHKEQEEALEKFIWGPSSPAPDSNQLDGPGLMNNIKPHYHIGVDLATIEHASRTGILFHHPGGLSHVEVEYIRKIIERNREAVFRTMNVPKMLMEEGKPFLRDMTDRIGPKDGVESPLSSLTRSIGESRKQTIDSDVLGDAHAPLRAFYKFTNLEYTEEELLEWAREYWEHEKSKGLVLPTKDIILKRFDSTGKLTYPKTISLKDKKLLL